MMVLTNPCCCVGGSCCCIPPKEITANTQPDGSGTYTVVFAYVSTTFLTLCGTVVAFHHYSLSSGGPSPGYIGTDDVTLAYWCDYPGSTCMDGESIPSTNYPASPFSRVMLYHGVVSTKDDLIDTTPLDLVGASCVCGVLVQGGGVQWRWDNATSNEHTDATYQAACPSVYQYDMTPCDSGTAFKGYDTTLHTDGTTFLFEGNCYTSALAEETDPEAVPLCGLTIVSGCEDESCGSLEPIQYRLETCFGVPFEGSTQFWFVSTDVIPDDTVVCAVFSSIPPMGSAANLRGKVYADASPHALSTLTSYTTGASCVTIPCP